MKKNFFVQKKNVGKLLLAQLDLQITLPLTPVKRNIFAMFVILDLQLQQTWLFIRPFTNPNASMCVMCVKEPLNAAAT